MQSPLTLLLQGTVQQKSVLTADTKPATTDPEPVPLPDDSEQALVNKTEKQNFAGIYAGFNQSQNSELESPATPAAGVSENLIAEPEVRAASTVAMPEINAEAGQLFDHSSQRDLSQVDEQPLLSNRIDGSELPPAGIQLPHTASQTGQLSAQYAALSGQETPVAAGNSAVDPAQSSEVSLSPDAGQLLDSSHNSDALIAGTETQAMALMRESTTEGPKPLVADTAQLSGLEPGAISAFLAKTQQIQQIQQSQQTDGQIDSAVQDSVAKTAVLSGMGLSRESTRQVLPDQRFDPNNTDTKSIASFQMETPGSSRHSGYQQGGNAFVNYQAAAITTASAIAVMEAATPDMNSLEQSAENASQSQPVAGAPVKKANISTTHPSALQTSSQGASKLFQTLDSPLSLRQAGWSEALSQRITLLHGRNIEQAQIQLDPPELGPLQVKINMQGDQVSVQFTSSQGIVRDALEQTSQRLAQLCSEEGIELLDVSVSDGNSKNEHQADADNNAAEDFDADALASDENLTQLAITRSDNGQIDYFV